MKSLLVLLTLIALCLTGAGCDKPDPQAAPRAFDRDIDGSIPFATVTLDPSALKERPTMDAPTAALAQPAAGSTETPETSAATPEAQVRQMMTTSAATMAEGDLEGAVNLLVDEQAEVVREALQPFTSTIAAFRRMTEVAESKLGVNPLSEFMPQSSPDAAAADPLEGVAFNTVSDVEVLILDAEGQPNGSAHLIDGQWRLRMPDEAMAQLASVADNPMAAQLAATIEQACNELSDGLENGSVTSDNFQQTVEAIMQQQVMPVFAGFMITMMADMGQPEAQPAAVVPSATSDPDDPYGGPLPENAYGPAGGGGGTTW